MSDFDERLWGLLTAYLSTHAYIETNRVVKLLRPGLDKGTPKADIHRWLTTKVEQGQLFKIENVATGIKTYTLPSREKQQTEPKVRKANPNLMYLPHTSSHSYNASSTQTWINTDTRVSIRPHVTSEFVSKVKEETGANVDVKEDDIDGDPDGDPNVLPRGFGTARSAVWSDDTDSVLSVQTQALSVHPPSLADAKRQDDTVSVAATDISIGSSASVRHTTPNTTLLPDVFRRNVLATVGFVLPTLDDSCRLLAVIDAIQQRWTWVEHFHYRKSLYSREGELTARLQTHVLNFAPLEGVSQHNYDLMLKLLVLFV